MTHSEYQPRRKRRKSWLGRFLIWSGGIVVVLLVAVAVATPWILRAAVPQAFARFGLQASVSGGRLSPLRPGVSLENFVLGAPDAPALSVGEFGVGFDLRALAAGRVRLRHLGVKDVSMDVDRLLELRKKIGGSQGSTPGRLPVELDELDLEDVRLLSLSERIGHDARIARLQVDNLSALIGDKKSSIRMQGSVGDGSLDVRLEVGLAKGRLEVAGSYHADALPLQGWARLANGHGDPMSAGTVSGRGGLKVDYSIDAEKLDLALDGRVTAAGLGLVLEGLAAERGDASWQGKLAIQWSPKMAAPGLRGDGNLDVEDLMATFAASSGPTSVATIKDVSWHGSFDLREAFTSDGAVSGTRIEVADGAKSKPAWSTRAENFSSRVRAERQEGSDTFGVRVHDFNLARLLISLSGGGSPVNIAAEKLTIDELRSARMSDLVLGQASIDALTITEAGGGDGVKVNVNRLTASGLSGDTAGRLHAARVSAESTDYRHAHRSLKADGIDLASVGLGAPKRLGVDEIAVESARLDEGGGDIWLSGLKAAKAYADAGGRFGAHAVNLTHIFQSGSSELTWEASDLALSGIGGDIHDTATLESADLGALKIGERDVSWESTALHAGQVTLTMSGDVNVARLGLNTLERRQPGTGRLRVFKLDGRAFHRRDSSATLDGVSAGSVEFRSPDGTEYTTHALEARTLSADVATGLEVSQLSVASAAGHIVGGTTLNATSLESRGLSVATGGSISAKETLLQSFSRKAPGSVTLGLDGLKVVALDWTRGGALSTASAAVTSARIVRPDGVGWSLSRLGSAKLGWDGSTRVSAERLRLDSVDQSDGNERDWIAQSLQAGGIRWRLPREIAVASAAAGSINGRIGSQAWKVASVEAKGFNSTESTGEKVDSLNSGAVTVSDESNGATLKLERTQADAVRISVLNELSANRIVAGRLRLASSRPDWPSRLSMARLRLANARLEIGGIINLDEVEATNPYLIVAESKDNAWMWPPLPGADATPAKGESKRRAEGGVRIGRLRTRGPGRFVYLDRATEPAFQLSLDPLVLAVQNLDTTLPGNRTRFRARGTEPKLAGVSIDGELTKRVQGFDLALEVVVSGAYLPSLNPYVARHEPIAVTAGWGDTHGKITIENHQLSGKVDVLLSGLELRTTTGGSILSTIDPANFPLRTALALLKDPQGDISISIPLKERTDDPKFDFVDDLQADFVRTVTAAGKAVGNLPGKTLNRALNLIEGTVSLLPGVDATRYSSIEFAVGRDVIPARPKLFLDQLGNRMIAHDELVLAPCGFSVPRDEANSAPDTSGIDKLFTEASNGVYPVYEPGHKGQLALAAARADSVRNFLRDIDGVANEQLDTCDARIDARPDAKPRVDFKVKSPAKSRGLFGLIP